MANYGLSKPWIAKLNETTRNYENAFKCGEAMTTSVKPNYAEASLYADNRETENIKEFKNADVSVGTSRLPKIAKTVLFGHGENEDGEEVSNTGDKTNFVGYGFISQEVLDGKTQYIACLLPKVKFMEGEEGYETKGDSIAFKTPTISGSALPLDGEWRIKSPLYDTEEEADEWIQKKLGALAQCDKPTASLSGGTYTGTQSVTLSTKTTSAKIMYTTNGTTPSETNGTLYKSAISISESIGLRAMAYKDGMKASEVMTEEFIIRNEEAV